MAEHKSSAAYEVFRTGLDDWRDRALQRAAALEQQEGQIAHRRKLKLEVADRKELEAKRAQEAAERAGHKRQEASQYFAWKADAILVRKAEEHARAAEHRQWRDKISQLRQGLPSDAAAALTPRAEVGRTVRSRSSFSRNLPVQSSGFPGAGSPRPTTGESGASPGISPLGTNRSNMFLPEDECGAISESERLRLIEDEAWTSSVARNRSVLHELYNRQQSEANGEKQPFSFRMPTWYPDENQSTAGKVCCKGQPLRFRVPTWYPDETNSIAGLSTTSASARGGSARLGSRLKAMTVDLSQRYEPPGT